MKTQTIKLPNGSTAVSFVPEDSTEKAIVHLETLRRITRYIPRENPRTIIREIIEKLSDNETNLDACMAIMQDELWFHQTVRAIDTYEPDNTANKAALAGVDISEGITAANSAIAGDNEKIDTL